MTRDQLDAIRARVEAAPKAGDTYIDENGDEVRILEDGDMPALLAEVERLQEENTVLVEANEGEPWAWQVLTKQRDALLAEVERLRDAHAMAVQVSGELCEKCGWAMRFPDEPCRCELLAEVERLTAEVESKVAQNVALIGQSGRLQQEVERLTALGSFQSADIQRLTRRVAENDVDWMALRAERDAAFKRGVAAMREAAAKYFDDRAARLHAAGDAITATAYSPNANIIRALPDPEDK